MKKCGLFLLLVATLAAAGIFLGLGWLHPKSPLLAIGPQDRMVEVNGLKLRYRAQGQEGPVVVFLHGFGGSLEEWAEVMAKTPGIRAYALDLPGFGGSDRSPTDYTLEAQRKHVLAFMDALGLEHAVLAGRSMGASLAAWSAAKSPERISGALLVAPSGLPGSLRYRWPTSWLYRPGALNRVSSWLIANRLFGQLFPLSLARQGVTVTACYDETFFAALFDIRQPVQLAWSKGDQRVPFTFSTNYRARIPGSRLTVLPASAGHDATWKAPAEVAAALQELLTRIPARK